MALKTGQGLTGKNGKNEEKPSHYRISRWHKRRPEKEFVFDLRGSLRTVNGRKQSQPGRAGHLRENLRNNPGRV